MKRAKPKIPPEIRAYLLEQIRQRKVWHMGCLVKRAEIEKKLERWS